MKKKKIENISWSITMIILRHISYLVYLSPCLGLGLFMSYLCDVFFIFSLIFVIINHGDSLNRRIRFLCVFRIFPIIFG